MKKFPIALALAAGLLAGLMAAINQGLSPLLRGLGEFSFSVFSFLVLMALFNDLTLGPSSVIKKILSKIQSFLTEEEIYIGFKTGKFIGGLKGRLWEFFSGKTQGQKFEEENPEDPKEPGEEKTGTADIAKGLVNINRAKGPEQMDIGSEKNYHKNLPVLYIVCFIGLALWRLSRIFTVIPLSLGGQLNSEIGISEVPGLSHALILLFLYCITIIYVKLRGEGPGDRAFSGLSMLLAHVFLVYAAVIGANSVLNINILPVLLWVIYAATFYLITALALNILISVFKNDIIDNFDYAIFPRKARTLNLSSDSERGSGLLDSEDIKTRFSIKSLYTIKYALKIIPAFILGLGFILLLSTSVFVVGPHQEAAVYRLGRLRASSAAGEGLHFKLPWPIELIQIYDTQRLKSLQIGYDTFNDNMNYFWDRGHEGSEYWLLLGNGNELVAVNMKLVYQISDLHSYIKTSTDGEAILSARALQSLMYRTANTTLDSLLGADRDILSSSIMEELNSFCYAENLGLSVIQVIIESIHPPVNVAYIYQRVVSAAADKETFITQASSDAEVMLIEAQMQYRAALDKALTEQFNRVSSARNEMALYHAAMEAYRINPRSYRLDQYLNTFERVIDETRVYVFSPGAAISIPRSLAGQRSLFYPPSPAAAYAIPDGMGGIIGALNE